MKLYTVTSDYVEILPCPDWPNATQYVLISIDKDGETVTKRISQHRAICIALALKYNPLKAPFEVDIRNNLVSVSKLDARFNGEASDSSCPLLGFEG